MYSTSEFNELLESYERLISILEESKITEIFNNCLKSEGIDPATYEISKDHLPEVTDDGITLTIIDKQILEYDYFTIPKELLVRF